MACTKDRGFLSGNALKLLAAAFMLTDHIGMLFFPRMIILRIIGRLAMPIFAYMIAEGCRYTHSRLRYLGTLFLCLILCQAGYYIGTADTYLCILATFLLGAGMTFCLSDAKKCQFDRQAGPGMKLLRWFLFAGSVMLSGLFCSLVTVDYGFWGCMLPVFASLLHMPDNAPASLKKLDNKWMHLLCFAAGLLLLSFFTNRIQFYCLFSLPLLMAYNGKRGKGRLKYFFYIFYPAHLLLLYGLFYILEVIR